MYHVYKVTNKINSKVYVGLSKNPRKRWRSYNKKQLIGRAIKHHGAYNFDFEILFSGDLDDCNEKERYYIEFYDSTDRSKGYNVAKGGVDVLLFNDEFKKYLSIKLSKDYEITFPNGSIKKIRNLTTFCKEHGLEPTAMIRLGHCRGFMCRKEGEEWRPQVIQKSRFDIYNIESKEYFPNVNVENFCEKHDLDSTQFSKHGHCQGIWISRKDNGEWSLPQRQYRVEDGNGVSFIQSLVPFCKDRRIAYRTFAKYVLSGKKYKDILCERICDCPNKLELPI